MWGKIIGLVIIILLVIMIITDNRFSFSISAGFPQDGSRSSSNNQENFQARWRPISGVGVSTNIYQRHDGMIREMSKAYEDNGAYLTADMIGGCPGGTRNLWDGAPGWGISPAMSGTVYRDTTCNGKVGNEKLYLTLHGM